jgi:hypothetical protein
VFGTFYCRLEYTYYGDLVYFMVIWYIFSRFGKFYQEKSGSNPGLGCALPPLS